MRRKYKYIALVVLLFLSIGFAILSSNLSIGSSIGISNASFDVHIEDAVIYQTNVSEVSNPIINSERDTVTLNAELDKPGDYVQVSFYVVNAGTIDAQLNEIISTTLSEEEKKYLTYSYQYLSSGTIMNTGDLLRVGQKRKILVSYQYKYDVTDFIDIDSKSLSLSLKYIQPNNYDDKVWTYNFENTYQTFKAPHTGSYKVELWGAKGGYTASALGGYVSGIVNLEKNTSLYVYVGERKTSVNSESFNGGQGSSKGPPGGGATDIRLIPNVSWKDDSSLNSRIMVAAGGGASVSPHETSGYAGGLVGGVSYFSEYENLKSTPATQTKTGSSSHACSLLYPSGFGIGGCCAGGGGGYWGGVGTAGVGGYAGGSGGSSFISGHNGCVAIKSATDRSPRLGTNNATCDDGTTDITCSYHYSGYKFTNTVMIDGQGYKWTTERGSEVVGMPTYDGTGTMTGNSGNGYAKITYLG